MPNPATAPSTHDVRPLQIEGLGIAILYTLSFLWVHLSAGDHLFSIQLAALFFGGLIAIPVAIGLPLVLMRRTLAPAEERQNAFTAIAPFARFALYGLQAVLVYLATFHAYRWLMNV